MRLFLYDLGAVAALMTPTEFLQANHLMHRRSRRGIDEDEGDNEDEEVSQQEAPKIKSPLAKKLDQVAESLDKGDAGGLQELLDAMARQTKTADVLVRKDANGRTYEDFTHPEVVAKIQAESKARRDTSKKKISSTKEKTAKSKDGIDSRFKDVANMLPKGEGKTVNDLLDAMAHRDEKKINAIIGPPPEETQKKSESPLPVTMKKQGKVEEPQTLIGAAAKVPQKESTTVGRRIVGPPISPSKSDVNAAVDDKKPCKCEHPPCPPPPCEPKDLLRTIVAEAHRLSSDLDSLKTTSLQMQTGKAEKEKENGELQEAQRKIDTLRLEKEKDDKTVKNLKQQVKTLTEKTETDKAAKESQQLAASLHVELNAEKKKTEAERTKYEAQIEQLRKELKALKESTNKAPVPDMEVVQKQLDLAREKLRKSTRMLRRLHFLRHVARKEEKEKRHLSGKRSINAALNEQSRQKRHKTMVSSKRIRKHHGRKKHGQRHRSRARHHEPRSVHISQKSEEVQPKSQVLPTLDKTGNNSQQVDSAVLAVTVPVVDAAINAGATIHGKKTIAEKFEEPAKVMPGDELDDED